MAAAVPNDPSLQNCLCMPAHPLLSNHISHANKRWASGILIS